MAKTFVKIAYMSLLSFVLPGLIGCGQQPSPARFQTPATFSGTIPCADCPGIRMSLTLRPDSLFYANQLYIEGKDPEHSSFTWWGHWSFNDSTRKISLMSGDHPQFMKFIGSDTVRLLDGEGNDIPSKLNFDLTRAPEVDTLPDTLRKIGFVR